VTIFVDEGDPLFEGAVPQPPRSEGGPDADAANDGNEPVICDISGAEGLPPTEVEKEIAPGSACGSSRMRKG
jgi:hypothetical protein